MTRLLTGEMAGDISSIMKGNYKASMAILTIREKEILKLIAEGMLNKEIAALNTALKDLGKEKTKAIQDLGIKLAELKEEKKQLANIQKQAEVQIENLQKQAETREDSLRKQFSDIQKQLEVQIQTLQKQLKTEKDSSGKQRSELQSKHKKLTALTLSLKVLKDENK